MAESAPLYAPGEDITRSATASITGPALVVVSGPGTVAPSTAATHSWLGVVYYDAATGDNVTVRKGGVHRLVAVGAITAGQNVEPAAAGGVAAHTNGATDFNIVGLALTSATNGQTVEVDFLR